MYFFKRLCDGSRARSPIRNVPRKAGAQKYDLSPLATPVKGSPLLPFMLPFLPRDSTSFRSCSSIDCNVDDRPQQEFTTTSKDKIRPESCLFG